MKIAGVDIGFGDTKIWTGDKYIKFPTAVAIDQEQGVDLGEYGHSAANLSYNGKKYIVGYEALLYDPMPTRNIDFLINYSPLIVAYAKQQIDFDTLTIGLPLGYYKEYGEVVRNAISKFTVNNKELTFDVKVLPQGVGIAYDYMYDKLGVSRKILTNAAIIDIGYNTIDILSITGGKANSKFSFMLENNGICQITTKLMNKLQKRFKKGLSESEAKKFLMTKQYNFYGVSEDISDLIHELVKEYAERIVGEIFIKADTVIKNADILIFSGGGSSLIRNFIPAKEKIKITFLGGELGEYSNAIGFYKQNIRGRSHANINNKEE